MLTHGSISVRMSNERWSSFGVFGLFAVRSVLSLQELTVRNLEYVKQARKELFSDVTVPVCLAFAVSTRKA